MPAPDVTINIIDAPTPPAPASATGTAFIVGLSDRGSAGTTAVLKPTDVITSKGDFDARYGTRQTYNGPEYDAMEAFFAEGGSRLFWSRKVGPAAVKASAAIPAAGTKFTAVAKGPGASYNVVTVAVASGVITVKDGATIVEVSPALADVVSAQAWATASSQYIDITPVGSGALSDSPAVALASGNDDRVNVTDVQIQAALDRFARDLGPGQVALPGDGRQLAYTMIATHARDKNRMAVADAPDTPTYTNVTALAASTRALGRELARHIVLLDPWLYAPGSGTSTQRTVPPSGVFMGRAAVNDAAPGSTPNRAIAGPRATSNFATSVKYSRTDAERSALADAGVTVVRQFGTATMPYDDVTPVDGTVDPEWVGAGANRFIMFVVANLEAIGRSHLFEPVAGSGSLAGFNGDIGSFLTQYVDSSQGPLYGDTPADAFRVETGPSVNTPVTIAGRQLKAAVSMKIAPNARFVIIALTNTGIAEVL
jgi:hypothetical protein